MKTHSNLFPKMCTFGALYRAYCACRQGKGDRDYAAEFALTLEESLFAIRDALSSGQWAPSGYSRFFVSDPKRRLINAPPFHDRIVHRAVSDILLSVWEPMFISDSYACLGGRGPHAAADRLQRFMRRYPIDEGYALQLDVKSYFASIDHAILVDLLSRKIRDRDLMHILHQIVDSYEDSPGTGVPLGNMTSQMFANIYLHELDVFAKHSLRIKHYIRYMDDVTIVHGDKGQLWMWRDEIAAFLTDRLKLRLHPQKQTLSPIDTGIDFLGYVVFRDHRRVRSRNIHRIYRNLDRIERGKFSRNPQSSIASWVGYAKHADTRGLNDQIARRHPFLRVAYEPITTG